MSSEARVNPSTAGGGNTILHIGLGSFHLFDRQGRTVAAHVQ